ncbi:phosphodiester glycosidase family protein [Kineococcus auxinigenes]|uniref:phosphodiester glycosidase family protein n=1 Tax=unclassified Kineococcus TaxID=2621656 RepID=UPI003D7DF1C4
MRRRTVLTGALSTLLLPAPLTARAAAPGEAGLPDLRALAAAPGRVELERTLTTVAPGLVLERLATLDAAGAVRTSLLRLAPGTGTRPALLQRSLSEPRTPAELAAAAGAVAAVNGDFFDIDRTGTPDGPVVVAGQPLKADAGAQRAVGVDDSPAGWAGRLGDVQLTGTATVGTRTWPLAALGTRTVPDGAVALFTPAWGAGDRALTAPSGVELEVRAGRVSAVRAPGAVPVPADGLVLVATGAAAAALSGTGTGTGASASVDVRVGALAPGSDGFALGARLELVRDGRVAAIDTADPTWAALRARTAIGWTRTGELLLLTADGGTARSRGLTAVETAQRMVQAGADGAVMLDGGGSAQLVARPAGQAAAVVVGEPSDGAPRAVAHAVGLLPPPSDGRATGIAWHGPGGRVFPGLHLAVTAVGTDAALAPAPLPGASASTADPAVAVVESSGASAAGGARVVLRGAAPGRTALRVRAGSAAGELAVEVLGPLRALELDPAPVLTAAGASADVQVVGRDGEGRRARVDAGDVQVSADPAQLGVLALPDGRVRLTAAGAGPVVAGLVLRAGAVSTTAGVALGLSTVPADPVADPARWSAAATRATASLVRVPVDDLPGVGAALRLAYDFRGQPAGTSVAAAVAGPPVALPTGTRQVALQVRGDGAGGWLRAVLRVDGAARPLTFAERVDFTGWRRLVAEVPAGARQVALERVYLAQTDVARRAAGVLDLAALEAGAAPVAPQEAAGPRDPALAPGPAPGTVTGPRTGRVAVLAAVHARAGRDGGDALLRQALRQAAAAGAQHVLLAGDAVGAPGGTGTDADVALVLRVLAAELPAGTGWSWLPGDGEVGTAAAAGPSSTGGAATHRHLDLAGTRHLLLDASGGSLRTAGFGQLPWLRAELDAAAVDDAVTGVVVTASRGPGAGAGDLSDPDESALLRTWAAGWRAGTGKRIALLGRAGGPAAQLTRREGVLEVGAARALVPGTTAGGWTLLTLDAGAASPAEVAGALPAGDDGWVRVHAHPLGAVVARRERRVR